MIGSIRFNQESTYSRFLYIGPAIGYATSQFLPLVRYSTKECLLTKIEYFKPDIL